MSKDIRVQHRCCGRWVWWSEVLDTFVPGTKHAQPEAGISLGYCPKHGDAIVRTVRITIREDDPVVTR